MEETVQENETLRPGNKDHGNCKLTDDLLLKIRKLVIDKVPYVDIQRTLGIKDNTWDQWYWSNYKGFRDKITQWKHERIVKSAERVLESLIDGEDDKIKADLAKFSLKTLNKEYYSERTEHTGKDGEPLVIATEISEKHGLTRNTEDSSEGHTQI